MKLKFLIRTKAGLRLLTAASLGLSAMNARAAGSAPDLDGDGVPNLVDPDIDNDGLPNAHDENIDGGIAKTGPYAGQFIGDHVDNDNPAELDIDGDGLLDDSLGETDIDGDGKTDNSAYEDDTDGDGRGDNQAAEHDLDGDGRLDDDMAEDDIDGDSFDDDDFAENDIDGDNSSDSLDDDIDGDSRGNSVIDDDDVDGDGRPNNANDEHDDDGDGASDRDDDDDNNDGVEDHNDDGHHDEDDEVEQKMTLMPSPEAPPGSSARVELQSMATGKMELKICGYDLPEGEYDIVIGDEFRGVLQMRLQEGELLGKTEFETGSNGHEGDSLPLNFPAAGATVTLYQGDLTLFSGIVPTPPVIPTVGDDDHHNHTYIQFLTAAAAAPAEAKAEAEIDMGVAGVSVFEVEIEDLPVGTYVVTLAGTVRGNITVVQLSDNTRGELRCETEPEASDEVLLDFPVVGLPMTITQNGTLFFSGMVPGGG